MNAVRQIYVNTCMYIKLTQRLCFETVGGIIMLKPTGGPYEIQKRREKKNTIEKSKRIVYHLDRENGWGQNKTYTKLDFFSRFKLDVSNDDDA